jgi:hypothetical protein
VFVFVLLPLAARELIWMRNGLPAIVVFLPMVLEFKMRWANDVRQERQD